MLAERIRNKNLLKKVVSPEEAAALIQDGMILGTASGIFSSGPRVFFQALAERGKRGEIKEVTVWSVSLLCKEIDGLLAEAGLLKRRIGSITDNTVRKSINSGKILSNDVRAEMMAHYIRTQAFGRLNVAVVEAVGITEEGHLIPTTGLVEVANQVEKADLVIVEVNTTLPLEIEGIHDVYVAKAPPFQQVIPLARIEDRIGTPYIPAGEEKITCIIESNLPEKRPPAQPITPESKQMAEYLLAFLKEEIRRSRLPANLLPVASGIGNVSDAVLKSLAAAEFEDLQIFSPLLGDGVIELIESGKCRVATGPGLLLSADAWAKFTRNIEEYRKKIIIRSIDVTHDPGVINRLGLLVLNNALEIDIYGHVNSSHIGGTQLVNGVGGGGIYAANAYLSVFLTLSTGKDGHISNLVPMVTHVDHTEHSVDVVVTADGKYETIKILRWPDRFAHYSGNERFHDFKNFAAEFLIREVF